MDFFKRLWLVMLEPPWQLAKKSVAPVLDWSIWLAFWAWAIAGMAGGAMIAPMLVQWAGLTNTSFADWLEIAIAVVAGVFAQAVGMLIALFVFALGIAIVVLCLIPIALIRREWVQALFDSWDEHEFGPYNISVYALMGLSPIACTGYGIYYYLNTLGANERTFAITFAGAFLVKAFAIPFIQSIFSGTLSKWFINWLRTGEKAAATKDKAANES